MAEEKKRLRAKKDKENYQQVPNMYTLDYSESCGVSGSDYS